MHPVSDDVEPAAISCSCPDEEEVGLVAYATGDASAAEFAEEERQKCPVHGGDAS